MRATSLAWLTAIILVSAGAVRLAAPTAAAAKPVPALKSERHPEIERAIAALERAKAHLQHAAHDFGGHRVEALAAVDKALESWP